MRVHAPFFYIEENNGIASYACVVPLVFMRIFKQLGTRLDIISNMICNLCYPLQTKMQTDTAKHRMLFKM